MFVLFGATRSYHLPHEEKSFVSWMRDTNQIFVGDEYQHRLGIWLTAKRIVEDHNKLGKFQLELNKFAHYTPAEYKALLGTNVVAKNYVEEDVDVTNDAVDWRSKGVVNAIKDQGQCGSCWAFGGIQAQESQWAIKKGKLYSLSESNLVDCVTTCSGCNGGLTQRAYTYVVNKQGGQFMLEDDYPYTPAEGTCKFNSAKAITKITGYEELNGGEKKLANYIAEKGPASIAIDASHYSFQLYHSGIYDEASCSSLFLDHEVGLVGYGTEGSTDFWIVRNSWGTSWGENGYVRMIRNKNNRCGVATEPIIPKV